MVALGAKGATLDEMTHVLGLTSDPAENAKHAKKLMASWKRAAGAADLIIANRLWLDQAFTIAEPFRKHVVDGYGSSPVALDFVHAQEESRQTINQWVVKATRGKLADSLPKNFITPRTRAIITDAVYFNGRWARAFNPQKTAPGPFLSNSGEITTAMMHGTVQMAITRAADSSVGTLAYRGSDLAMVVVLPDEKRPLRDVVQSLTVTNLDQWENAARVMEVDVSMPKFTFAWGRSLLPELQAMGMRAAFDEDADFSALAVDGSGRVRLDDVLHRAFVLVDEAGTQAAAVTQGRWAAIRAPRTFAVNRPFLFFIRNQRTGDLLFAGRVVNPKQA
jgi:serpin B